MNEFRFTFISEIRGLKQQFMHELSIAMSIVEGASAEAARHGGARVHAVHLKLGALSGVVKDALLFSYDLACEGTPLQGSKLVIEEVPVVVYCARCDANGTIESIQKFACPACGTLTPEVVGGKQLELVAIEISDGDETVENSELAEASI